MRSRTTFVAIDTAPLKGALAVGHGLLRNMTFCIVECDLGSERRAADVLTPAPGQGLRPDVLGSCGPNTPAAGPSLCLGAVCKTGWGGGRNLAGAVPAFDPHPSLPPARGKVKFRLPAPRQLAAPVVSSRTPHSARAVGCLTHSSPTDHRSGGLRKLLAPWTGTSRSTTRLNGQEPPSLAAQRKSKT